MTDVNTIKPVKRLPFSTVKEIEGLKPSTKPYDIGDASSAGLRLRVSPLGALTWFYRYKSPATKKNVKITLGSYDKSSKGGLSLAQARAQALEYTQLTNTGKCPKQIIDAVEVANVEEAKQRAATDRKQLITMQSLVDAYIDAASGFKKSWGEDKRILSRELTPFFGDVSVYELSRGNVREVINNIRGRGKPVQANRALSCIRAMFNWALENDWPSESNPLAFNPCAGLKVTKEKPRERALNDVELKQVLKALPEKLKGQDANIVLFLLATGSRISEVVEMKWSHVFDAEWRQPEGKNGFGHIVYLSDFALLQLRAQCKDLDKKAGYIWPNSKTNQGHVRVDYIDKLLRSNMALFKVEKFTPHDLRRTLATWLGENEVDERIHDRILNHATGGIRRVYNIAKYNNPAREWWLKWGDHLESLTGDNDE